MQSKTFAFKLSNEAQKGSKKWKARDGIALASCTEVIHMNYRDSSAKPDDSIFC